MLSISAASFGSVGRAASVYNEKVESKIFEVENPLLCRGAKEYIATLEFFRKNKEIILVESAARKIAERVSRGCDGATERFSRVLILLKSVGLSDLKALEISLDFAGRSPDVQKNFVEILSRSFLSEFFDYDYSLAAKLAYELSRDYKGDPRQVRDDFLEMVRFCKSEKNLDLPARLCAELTIKLARLSQFYPNGVRHEFFRLFKDLRIKPEFGMNVRDALDVAYNVLKNGPRGTENFFTAFEYASKKQGLDMSRLQALSFALEMSQRSFVGEAPPILSKAPDPLKAQQDAELP